MLGVLAPAEHAAHLAAVESGTAGAAESVARIEQLITTTGAGVCRIEAKIETLLQLHELHGAHSSQASSSPPHTTLAHP